MHILGVVLAILAILSVVNIVTSLSFAIMRRVWLRKGRRNNEGILESAIPFTVGEGAVAVLFVHGFNDVPYVWRRMVDRLAKSGLACRAMRLPGAGDRAGTTKLCDLLAAVQNEFDALASSHGRVFVVAHSMGGALVVNLINEGRLVRGKLGGVVLLAPLIEVSCARSPLLSPYAYYLLFGTLFPLIRWLPSVFRECLVAEDDPTFVYSRDRFIHRSWYDALFLLVKKNQTPPEISSDIPFRVYVAGGDRVVDSDASVTWTQRRGIPVRMLEGAAHPIPLLCEWRRVTDEICAWIQIES